MRMKSYARDWKQAKVDAKGIFPSVDMPRAAPTMFCSAMNASA